MTVRFVISVDINENDVPKAYKMLLEVMAQTEMHKHVNGWESTDEAFDSSDKLMTPAEFQAHIESS